MGKIRSSRSDATAAHRQSTSWCARLSAVLAAELAAARRSKICAPTNATGSSAHCPVPLAVALPENEEQVRAVLRICHRSARAGGRARRRHRPFGRRDAARQGVMLALSKLKRILEIDPLARGRTRAARRAQPRDFGGRSAVRPLLRTRPFEPDRVHHRRQRRRELGRRALPEVRAHRAQPAQAARRHDRRRAARDRRGRLGCARLRPAGADDRFRRAARAS